MTKREKVKAKPLRIHHVVPKSSGGWAIKMEGTGRAIKVFSKKVEAIEFAHKISRKQGSSLVIHGRDGRIMATHQHKNTLQHEPLPESGFGCARGLIVIPPDFDKPLEEFDEYS